MRPGAAVRTECRSRLGADVAHREQLDEGADDRAKKTHRTAAAALNESSAVAERTALRAGVEQLDAVPALVQNRHSRARQAARMRELLLRRQAALQQRLPVRLQPAV